MLLGRESERMQKKKKKLYEDTVVVVATAFTFT